MSMSTKTIAIMEDVYDMLKSMKTADESFSDEIRRLVQTKGSIMKFAGAWKDVTEEEAEKMKATIREMRKKSNERLHAITKRM